MKRNIFRKVPISEKKQLFKVGAENRIIFHSKGESEDLITLVLTEVKEGKILKFSYATGSPKFTQPQDAIFNFSHGEDRFFFQAAVDVYQEQVMIPIEVDVFILQRRKTPRLDLPPEFPAGVNVIQHKGRVCLYECKILDFSSGGCRAQYGAHLPAFSVGDELKVVVHLSHRRPLELISTIRHHMASTATAQQVFGMQFKLDTTILENKLLVVFMDLQRELFTKWGG